MAGANDYESELTTSRAEIAAVLSGVVDGVLAGSMRLGDGTDATTVAFPEELALETELETEDGELSLELELTWPAPEGEESVGSPIEDLTEEGGDELPEEEGDERPEEGGDELPEEGGDDLSVSVGAADASQALARFEVFRDQGEEWRWRLRHRNGNIIATSGEGYTRKHNARKGLLSVMKNAPGAAVTDDPQN